MAESKRTVYVGKIPFGTSAEDLRVEMSKAGHVVHVRMQQSYAFVEYSTEEEAREALNSERSFVIKNCKLKINVVFDQRKSDKKSHWPRPGFLSNRHRSPSPSRSRSRHRTSSRSMSPSPRPKLDRPDMLPSQEDRDRIKHTICRVFPLPPLTSVGGYASYVANFFSSFGIPTDVRTCQKGEFAHEVFRSVREGIKYTCTLSSINERHGSVSFKDNTLKPSQGGIATLTLDQAIVYMCKEQGIYVPLDKLKGEGREGQDKERSRGHRSDRSSSRSRVRSRSSDRHHRSSTSPSRKRRSLDRDSDRDRFRDRDRSHTLRWHSSTENRSSRYSSSRGGEEDRRSSRVSPRLPAAPSSGNGTVVPPPSQSSDEDLGETDRLLQEIQRSLGGDTRSQLQPHLPSTVDSPAPQHSPGRAPVGGGVGDGDALASNMPLPSGPGEDELHQKYLMELAQWRQVHEQYEAEQKQQQQQQQQQQEQQQHMPLEDVAMENASLSEMSPRKRTHGDATAAEGDLAASGDGGGGGGGGAAVLELDRERGGACERESEEAPLKRPRLSNEEVVAPNRASDGQQAAVREGEEKKKEEGEDEGDEKKRTKKQKKKKRDISPKDNKKKKKKKGKKRGGKSRKSRRRHRGDSTSEESDSSAQEESDSSSSDSDSESDSSSDSDDGKHRRHKRSKRSKKKSKNKKKKKKKAGESGGDQAALLTLVQQMLAQQQQQQQLLMNPHLLLQAAQGARPSEQVAEEKGTIPPPPPHGGEQEPTTAAAANKPRSSSTVPLNLSSMPSAPHVFVSPTSQPHYGSPLSQLYQPPQHQQQFDNMSFSAGSTAGGASSFPSGGHGIDSAILHQLLYQQQQAIRPGHSPPPPHQQQPSGPWGYARQHFGGHSDPQQQLQQLWQQHQHQQQQHPSQSSSSPSHAAGLQPSKHDQQPQQKQQFSRSNPRGSSSAGGGVAANASDLSPPQSPLSFSVTRGGGGYEDDAKRDFK